MLSVDAVAIRSGVATWTREGKLRPPRNVKTTNHQQSHTQRLTLTNQNMAVLSFSLTPEATGRIYEALVCLAKFGEAVAIEARGDKASFLEPAIKYQT
jgi:hypothetical protein